MSRILQVDSELPLDAPLCAASLKTSLEFRSCSIKTIPENSFSYSNNDLQTNSADTRSNPVGA